MWFRKVRKYTLTSKTLDGKRLYWLVARVKDTDKIYECNAQALAEKLVDILATEGKIILIDGDYGRTPSQVVKEYLYERKHFGRTA